MKKLKPFGARRMSLVSTGRLKFAVPTVFVAKLRKLLQQTQSVLDFTGCLEIEELEPMLAHSLFEVLRTHLAPAQEELATLCGENENRYITTEGLTVTKDVSKLPLRRGPHARTRRVGSAA